MNALDLEITKHFSSRQPLVILKHWLKEALEIPHLKEPWAMVLSTSQKGKVSSRVVLLKQIRQSQLFFYTNYSSRKGKDMKINPFVAGNFYWPQLERQIRITGKVNKTNRRKSILYWQSRNRNSQISQWISQQSQVVESKQELENLKKRTEKQFQGQKIPCPKHWGGYSLQIETIEFWINRKHRLHDRFLFKKSPRGWKKQRLFP